MIVEIAEDDEVEVGIGLESCVDEAPEPDGFLFAQVGLVRRGGFATGFEVGDNEVEAIAIMRLNLDFGEAAADAEPSSVKEESLVGVGPAGGERESAEDGDVDVGVESGDVFPMSEIEAGALKIGAKFEEGVGSADFLERQDVGADGEDTLAQECFGLVGFLRAR